MKNIDQVTKQLEKLGFNVEGAFVDNSAINKILSKNKKVYVIAQDEASSTVYGMPRAIYEKGMCDVVCDINDIAKEIIKKVGVL